ncbi:phage baseplate assembly protein [Bosea eneae]|uniref:Phage baseplate assembly protein n=1 Tax=Bosea eneae TaxID=151454 RepID=A0ABW0IVZ7_9HYPH
MSDAEIPHAYRGIVARAAVRSTNDKGGSQTATVEVHRHVERTDVEVLGVSGVSSRPPPGGEAIVLAVGGDQGDLVALPLQAPGNRMGGLEEGEVALHNLKADRVHVKKDGSIESTSRKRVKSKVKDATDEVLEDRIVNKVGAAATAPRVVVRPTYVKLVCGPNWLVVKADGIFSSVPVVVGPDPEPGV